MKRLLLATAFLASTAMPVLAANTALILWNDANPGGFESATGTDTADLTGTNLGGVTLTLSFVNRGTNPNDLTEGNIQIANTTSTTQTIEIIAGANGYAGLSTAFSLTGTFGVTLGLAELSAEYFVDAGNGLNGTSESITGASIDSFDSGGIGGPHSFSFNGVVNDLVAGPYGLAEHLELTLAPGAQIFVQGVSMDSVNPVPEPSTWAMGIAGFGFLAFFGLNKARKDRLASI